MTSKKDNMLEMHTSWQWLNFQRRIPKEGAVAHCINYEMDMGYGWLKTAWYYYYKEDTKEVSPEVYEKLKALYIEKFGGWEKIDLDNTTYDGHIWW